MTLLHCLQNAVALCFVPSMAFVKKQIGLLAIHTKKALCLFYDLFGVSNPCGDRIEFDKVGVGVFCDNVGKRVVFPVPGGP